MSTLSIHPIEYLKLHLHYEETRRRVLTLLVKKVFDSATHAATLVATLLMVALVVLALINLRQAGVATASFNDAIAKMPVPPSNAISMLPSGL
jgi:hypothetical protein